MNYSQEFENELQDLEAVAVRIAAADNHSEREVEAKHHFGVILDDILNTYPVDCEPLTDHCESVGPIYHSSKDESTASKHISTARAAFLSGVCDDYDPQF